MTDSIIAIEASDRRPIRARRLHAFQFMATRMARAGIGANTISIAGMVCGVAAGATLFATSRAVDTTRILWLASAGLVQLRLLANMLDGMVALESQSACALGELYNDLPDRVSDSAVLIGLGYALGGSPTLGWLAALLAMATAYVRAAGRAAGAGSDFSGPMSKPQRMFVVTIAALVSAAATNNWTRAAPTFALWIIIIGCALTVARRVAHAASALRMSR